MFHSMFMNGTVRRADLWLLECSVFTRAHFEHVYRCSPPMQPHHAKSLEKAHESVLRKRQIPVVPPSLASGLRKLKSYGLANACIWFGIAHRLHGNLLVSYYQPEMVADTCQDQRRGCLVTFTFYFRSQGKPMSTVVPPCKVFGSSNELRSPTNNNNNNNSTTTQLRFLRCKYSHVGALFWGRRSP